MIAEVDKRTCIVYTSLMERDSVLIMRFPAEVKAALRRAAEEDHRSMSGLVLKLVSDYLIDGGYLPAPPRRGQKDRG
jgi:hypothetical protein